jgi:hypothetical protein
MERPRLPLNTQQGESPHSRQTLGLFFALSKPSANTMPPVNFIGLNAVYSTAGKFSAGSCTRSQSKIVGQKTPITAKFDDKKPRFVGYVVTTYKHLKNGVVCVPLNEPLLPG